MSDIVQVVMLFLAAVPSIVFHEVSHGYVAYLLGDPTAKSAKRLSLNPFRHVDPFGTVLLPALLALARLPAFGYAKPVPINPRFFKNYRVGMMLTGLAGPGTNLMLAVVAGLVVRFAAPFANGLVSSIVVTYLFLFTQVNLVLLFFNLIPIPPFDGSRVLPIFLSDEAMRVYAKLEQYGFIIVFAILFIFRGAGILQAYFSVTVDPLLRLIVG